MKLSLSWIFDHIDADWKKQDIQYLVEKFNKTSAEIERHYKINLNLENFALCKVVQINSDKFKIFIPEWDQEIFLPLRDDSKSFLSKDQQNFFYMVYKKGKEIFWAQLSNFDQEKEGLIPPLDVTEKDLDGDWKKHFEKEDIIFEIDNKSITHRPDMWGHRGFAREIAAIFDLKFFSEEKFLQSLDVATFDKVAKATDQNPISIEIKNKKACLRFAGLYFDSIENRPCHPFILSRLLKVGVRPINSIVDLTNYLTLDWSQPVHVYDAQKIEKQKIVVRLAKKKEKLTLLDGSELELLDQDLVIADSKKSLCLAGVMGGINSVVDANTKSIFFESANFDSLFVRRSSLYHKVRTESSMRFEKTLDTNQNLQGIFRFLKLAKQFGIKYKCADQILSVGLPVEEKTLHIKHEFFENRSGVRLTEYDVIIPLEKLGFIVEKDKVKDLAKKDSPIEIIYSITIPTFRGSKDIEIKEDILEEIIRFYGFEKIPLDLPNIKKCPSNDLSFVFRIRKIKNFFSSCAGMMEQQNYAFYDEQFLSQIGIENQKVAAEIINPVSENSKKLILSLLPGLFKNIKDNFVLYDNLRFFELGRVWNSGKKDEIIEHKMVSGIFFEKRKKLDFYKCKDYLLNLLELIGINFGKIEWKRVDDPNDLWAAPHQTAQIFYNGKIIGIAGKVNHIFLNRLEALESSDAFFFELDADFLIDFVAEIPKFKQLPKYQETFIDFSVFVPLSFITEKVENLLRDVDELVTLVELIDFFEKEEWLDKRSLTFRLWINHPEKTLEKHEIEDVWKKAVSILKAEGIEVRGLVLT
ncbi:phenylalanine--tRNA ligase subunit beta [Candidatus Babeliales bacterium]|nr:phenylalanine--tRNA ligase subunit beta [Candidatus Babeliales bacterium]